MHKDFKIDSNILEYISKKFNVNLNDIQIFKKYFEKECQNIVESQYLAHIIRLFEILIRKKTKNPLFIILLKPFIDEKLNYFGQIEHIKGKFAKISYPKYDNTKDNKEYIRQIRVIIAHELGHLFISELLDKNAQDFTSHPYSSIFGILTIIEKNRFYEDNAKNYNHNSCNHIIDDFYSLPK